ncbi:hypothetical protein V5R04_10750 [Jonesiaceae bacterium BS-20]|uniref:DUF304 domain-containing protein n=1 Tax=Jonesiaceae bacterium BS-20 TaxID=3120821 RepID=A0AAU7DRZ4_9MICO
MSLELNNGKNWAHWAKRFRIWMSLPFCLVGLLGIFLTLSEQSTVATIVCLAIFGINLVEILGALSSRVEIGETSLKVYGLLKGYEVNLVDILSVEVKRWDGGFYFIAFGPFWIKSPVLLTNNGEIELDTAFGTKRKVMEFQRALMHQVQNAQPHAPTQI